MQKLSFTRAYMRAAELADHMLGIAGGTDEVQKNIIAKRQLGLPK